MIIIIKIIIIIIIIIMLALIRILVFKNCRFTISSYDILISLGLCLPCIPAAIAIIL